MRRFVGVLAAACLGAGCAGNDGPTADGGGAQARRAVVAFEGEVDLAAGTLTLRPAGDARPTALTALPEGGGADTVVVTTTQAPAPDGACGGGALSAPVRIQSFFGTSTLQDVYAVIDTLSGATGVVGCNSAPDANGLTSANGGLWSYGAIGVLGAAVQTWSFGPATGTRFTFTGHVEATLVPVTEPDALVGTTAEHDAVRDTVGVPHLVWDPALATVAQAWVSQCQSSSGLMVDHNPNRTTEYGTGEYVGENAYATTAASVTPHEFVSAWASEVQYYDYATNTCAAGQTCGHYTQLVWRSTTRVGCGIATCPALTYPLNVVCDYAPGGNYVGQWPY